MSGYSSYELTKAVIAWLTGDTEIDTVFAGERPDLTELPYVGVDPFFSGPPTGTIVGDDRETQAIYVLTSWSTDHQQVEWLADRVRNRMHGAALSVNGATVLRVSEDQRLGVNWDARIRPILYWAPDRYRIHIEAT